MLAETVRNAFILSLRLILVNNSITPSNISKLLDKVQMEPMSGCWLWSGSQDKDGYGRCSFKGNRGWRSHRLFYLIFKGPLVKGQMIIHKCDTPSCVNPDHLRQGTAHDNMEDMASKGRGVNQKKTHCPFGHEYKKETTYAKENGQRVCKLCMRERDHARYKKNREKVLKERKQYYAENRDRIRNRKSELRGLSKPS